MAKTVHCKIYRNINLSCLLLRTQLGRSIAKQLVKFFYYINTARF